MLHNITAICLSNPFKILSIIPSIYIKGTNKDIIFIKEEVSLLLYIAILISFEKLKNNAATPIENNNESLKIFIVVVFIFEYDFFTLK